MTEPKPRRFTAEEIRCHIQAETYQPRIKHWLQIRPMPSRQTIEILEQAAADAERLSSMELAVTHYARAAINADNKALVLAKTVTECKAELEWIYTNWPEVKDAVRVGRSTVAAPATQETETPNTKS